MSGSPEETVLPTAAIQRQIVAHEALIDGAPAYNLLAGAELHGPVDAGRLTAAFARLVDAHPALRARIVANDEGLGQAIAPPGSSSAGLEVREVAAGEALVRAREFARLPIEVFSGPPWRLCLFVESAAPGASERSVLALVLHHVLGDGHSLVELCTELGAAYAEPDAPSGGDGAVGTESERLAAYRAQILAAEKAAGPEAAGSGAPAFRSGRGAIWIEPLGEWRTELLRRRAREARVTPYSIALAAFALGLGDRFGCETMELAVPATTRSERSAFAVVGPLMRMARVRIALRDAVDEAFLADVQKAVLRATFGGGGRIGGGEAWTLEHGLAFAADIEPAQHLRLPGVEVEPLILHPDTSVFGLTGTLETVRGDEFRLRLEAAEETMGESEARSLLAAVLAAIDGLVALGPAEGLAV